MFQVQVLQDVARYLSDRRHLSPDIRKCEAENQRFGDKCLWQDAAQSRAYLASVERRI